VRLPRLVASDLDGTLLGSDGMATERARVAVAAIQRAGIRVVLVTARPPRWLHDLGRGPASDARFDLTGLLDDDGIVICANGGLVYDAHRRAVVEENTLSPAVVRDVVGAIRDAVPGVAFAVETRLGLAKEDAFVETVIDPGTRIGRLEDLLDPPPAKLLARASDHDPEVFLARVQAAVGDRAVFAYSGAGGLAEISANGVTKAVVLARWAERWGVQASDVWAFGDMPNDLPMLTWAGRSFGVANAHPDVLAVVTDVCGSNDADGVAEVLESLLPRDVSTDDARGQY
jgi:HAD superfamily hydrolase (TIGR01484 family)